MTIDTQSVRDDLLSLGLDAEVADAWVTDDLSAGGPSAGPSAYAVWWQDEAKLVQVCEELKYTAEIRDVFLAASRRITQTAPAWWTLLAIASRCLLNPTGNFRSTASKRPSPSASTWGELSDLYPGLIHFTSLQSMVHDHRAMGIPPAVTVDTADDLPLRMEEFHQKHGRWGTTDTMHWFSGHLRRTIYKLGRLQFTPADFGLSCIVLANKQGESVAMALGNFSVRADGQFATTDKSIAVDAPDNWMTTLTQTSDAITGHVIDEQGCIQRKLTTFDLNDWRVALKQGDQTLAVHIPARGRLDPAACVESFTSAAAFYAKFYPELKPVAFTCISWLMDPQLTHLEQGQSNLGRFIRLFHPIPMRTSNDDQMFERVFDRQTDLKTLPRDTSLRKGLIAHMEQGKKWRSAGGYRLI